MSIRQLLHATTLLLLISGTGFTYAADCVLNIARTACPGEEKESFSKCNGSASCEENKPAVSAAQCISKAKSSCANSRLTITKNKKVTAKFDGAALEGGRDFCLGHPDYPYAQQAACKN